LECPNCKSKSIKGYICNSCGVDIFTFSKSIKVSNLLYNKGLEKANNLELSFAIELLCQSIEFNKNNYYSRNLLGLIYYETGRIGDALKQWIISSNLVKTNNIAMSYMHIIQNNPDDLYSKNEAVVHYNKALDCLNKKNTDMAITDLKKAITINPNFLNAINLLTFCNLIIGNKSEALNLITKALKIDKNNKITENYHLTITGTPPKQTIESQRQKILSQNLTPPPSAVEPKMKRYSFINFFHIISFIFGSVIMLALMFFFIIPGSVSDMEQQILHSNNEIERISLDYTNFRVESDTRITELLEDNENLYNTLTELRLQINIATQNDRINEARLILAANPLEAAELLYEIDLSLIEEENLEEIIQFRDSTFLSAASSLYNSGLQQYNLGNFEISVGFFERSLRFAEAQPEDLVFIDDIIYFLGRIAQHGQEYERAASLFLQLITEFPDSNVFSQASERLHEILSSNSEQDMEND